MPASSGSATCLVPRAALEHQRRQPSNLLVVAAARAFAPPQRRWQQGGARDTLQNGPPAPDPRRKSVKRMEDQRNQANVAARRLADLRAQIAALESQAEPSPAELTDARRCWEQLVHDVKSLQRAGFGSAATAPAPVAAAAATAALPESPAADLATTVSVDKRTDGSFALNIAGPGGAATAAAAEDGASEIGQLIPDMTPRGRTLQPRSSSSSSVAGQTPPDERSPADRLVIIGRPLSAALLICTLDLKDETLLCLPGLLVKIQFWPGLSREISV